MKVAVSAFGTDINAQINPRFGRCDYLLIVDTDSMDVEVCSNDFKDMSSGAGTQSAALVISKGAATVLTGSCGPKAMAAFQSENIPVITGLSGTVKDAVEQFKKGKINPNTAPDSAGQYMQGSRQGQGMCGGGMGRGMCGGGGRGMGGGGRGMGGGGRGMGGGGRGMGNRG